MDGKQTFFILKQTFIIISGTWEYKIHHPLYILDNFDYNYKPVFIKLSLDMSFYVEAY